MMTRLTITAVAAAFIGLMSQPSAAQQAAMPIYGDCEAGCDTGADCTSGAMEVYAADPGRRLHHPGCLCPLCHPRHTWGTFDALLWWGKSRTVPALATTSPQITPSGDAGVIGEPGTRVLFGDGGVGNRSAGGARVDFGFWWDDCESIGFGAKFWGIDGDQMGRTMESPDADPILARPFYNILLDEEDALLIAYPGLVDGMIDIETDSSVLGAEAYIRSSMFVGRGYNVDLIGGYHFVRLDDDVEIRSNSVVSGGILPVGTMFDVADTFDCKNEFHGGQIGVVGEARRGRWTVTGLAKLSVGNMRQRVFIDGSTVTTAVDGTQNVEDQGLLALPSNIGRYATDEVALIPEANLTLAFRVRDWLHLNVGYNAIYWSTVVLAGDQIDRVINESQIGGGPVIPPPRPEFRFRDSEYWMHGFNFGTTITY